MILLEEMKLLEEQKKSDEVRQNHIKLLLETAKVEVPQEPSQKILETDELIEMLRSQARFDSDSLICYRVPSEKLCFIKPTVSKSYETLKFQIDFNFSLLQFFVFYICKSISKNTFYEFYKFMSSI